MHKTPPSKNKLSAKKKTGAKKYQILPGLNAMIDWNETPAGKEALKEIAELMRDLDVHR